MIGLQAAMSDSDEKTIGEICKKLANTERNFISKKNETTRDLRRAEFAMEADRKWFSVLVVLVAAVRSSVHVSTERASIPPRPPGRSNRTGLSPRM